MPVRDSIGRAGGRGNVSRGSLGRARPTAAGRSGNFKLGARRLNFGGRTWDIETMNDRIGAMTMVAGRRGDSRDISAVTAWGFTLSERPLLSGASTKRGGGVEARRISRWVEILSDKFDRWALRG
jgi:hypothetical protein